jgi:HEPN domain-containing protein
MKPSRDAAQRWLRQAEHDLRIARGHHERADYSDACFMAEQAAQKALKAFLM